MSRRAAANLPLLGILAALLGLPFFWRFLVPPAPAPAPAAVAIPANLLLPPPTDAAHVDALLIRAGISPRALAAVGVPSYQVGTLVSNARAHLLSSPTAISVADGAYATAKREVDRLKRLIESGRGSAEDVQSFQTQSAALATASAQQTAALSALFEAAAQPLSAPQRQLLQRIKASSSWELPIEFSVVTRTDTEWLELRSALANVRVHGPGRVSAGIASARNELAQASSRNDST